jgi:hypothetical protein
MCQCSTKMNSGAKAIIITSTIIAVVAITVIIVLSVILSKKGNATTNGSTQNRSLAGSLVDHSGIDEVINLAVFNQSTVVSDSEFQAAVQAVQMQVSRDFYPIYKIDANLLVFTPDQISSIPSDYFQVAILDTSDQAGALGYHSLTSSGMPFAKVFAKTSQDYNLSWTTTFSHEVLETLADPWAELSILLQTSNTTGNVIAFEVCDPVQDDSFAYRINGVSVSDFVYPAWFEFTNGTGPFDHTGGLSEPLEIGSGGYALVFKYGTGWEDVTTTSDVSNATAPASSAAGRSTNQAKAPVLLCGRASIIKNKINEIPRHAEVAKSRNKLWKKLVNRRML